MQPFAILLICLNLSSKDRRILAHASNIARSFDSAKLVFLHTLTDESTLSNSDAEQLLRNSAASFAWDSKTFEIEYVVVLGEPFANILSQASKHKTNLIICGKSNREVPHQVLPIQLARKSPCSVFLAPSESEYNDQRILVAVDKSEHSKAALQVAARISAKHEASILILARVIETPFGNQVVLGSNHVVDLKEQEREQVESFAANSDLGDVKLETAIISNQKASQAILETAKKRNATMIVMGSKGKGALAATLLGSTVENVARATRLPLLIVKLSTT
ncbi:MAG: nucleotide-binding universal stress UspA family protein [Candidatus Pelagisphaera sp.]|jgi:nucleotide-binding universal stress UspA family protein